MRERLQVHVDDVSVRIGADRTVLDAARAAGAFVPTLCNVEGKPPTAACRLCLVRIDGRGGLASACSTPVHDGMRITTSDAQITQTRRVIVEMVLAEHGRCGRADCEVEALAQRLGARTPLHDAHRRVETRDLGSDFISVQPELCVHCDRCIKACPRGLIVREGRGTTVSASYGPSDGSMRADPCTGCGDCIAACPAGVLRARPRRSPA